MSLLPWLTSGWPGACLFRTMGLQKGGGGGGAGGWFLSVALRFWEFGGGGGV